ncbi:4'-phosphopantetheinyl transferase family protein [Clostridium estertheticum]|uniref:4'-phosphopantetheinyl transferase family protein n=1 Tax=Clostridium estertheticum TaxID=238834 RepID=UPI001CF2F8CF|nr:4'-phosphopantetheinyl transferase family protein [Clostridium estertheticum]MCB2360137.1 4'-phosphopantetheinyl transferase superfamily protein [Clostridium estertheticum]
MLNENYKLQNTYVNYFSIRTLEEIYKVYFCFYKINSSKSIEIIKYLLHYNEYLYFQSLKYEKKIESFLLGRYIAKKSISALVGERDLRKIWIKNGIFNQPSVICESANNVLVSITHCEKVGASIAFSDMLLMGIDIEKIDIKRRKLLNSQLTHKEKEKENEYINLCSYDSLLTIYWTVKESISKVIKTGFLIPIDIFEVKKIEAKDDCFVSCFSNFPQFTAISIIVEEYVYSMVYPKSTEIIIDIHEMSRNLKKIITCVVEN